MNRFAFIVCKDGHIEFVIPEINLRGSEPTENVEDVVSNGQPLQRNRISGDIMEEENNIDATTSCTALGILLVCYGQGFPRAIRRVRHMV